MKFISTWNEQTQRLYLRYCPWCEDPALESGFRSGCFRDTRRNLYVLDDRLYDFIENFPRPETDRYRFDMTVECCVTASKDEGWNRLGFIDVQIQVRLNCVEGVASRINRQFV